MLVAMYSLFAPGLCAQGTVNFDNNIPGIIVTHMYIDSTFAYTGVWRVGNGPDDTPLGGTDYSGDVLLQGSDWYAQLWAGPGITEYVQPAYPITTFQTGPDAGFVKPVTVSLTGVPADAPVASGFVRVWASSYSGRAINDWAAAVNMGVPRAESPLFRIYDIGGLTNAPALLTGLQSFSVIAYAIIPEPSTAALLGLGLGLTLLQALRITPLHQRRPAHTTPRPRQP